MSRLVNKLREPGALMLDERGVREEAADRIEELEGALRSVVSENPSCECFDWDALRYVLDGQTGRQPR